VALLLACTVLFTYELLSFRKDTYQRLTTIGRVIADNSTAALVFDDQTGANEILAALAAEPQIVAAGLYDQNGRLFSRYPAALSDSELPERPGPEGFGRENGHLAGFHNVAQGGKQVGTLYLKADMSEMYTRMQIFGGLVFLVILASLFVATIFSRRLQRQISLPILTLAETAKTVSQKQDYSVRAQKLADDELGLLTDTFNHMLSQIQERDKDLRESEERFRLMVWNVQDYAIVLLDPSGCVLTWNVGGERLLGYHEKEIVGQHYARFFTAELVASGEPEHKIKMAAKFGRDEYESFRIRKDGSLFKANVVLTALWKASGQLTGFCEVTRDITEPNLVSDELQKVKNQVKSAELT
jgi:PAS domain S-box-containing protein